MAPIIELPPLDALDAFTSVVKRRIEEEAAYDDESDYSDDNDDIGYSSVTEGDGQASVEYIIDCEDGDFVCDSTDDGDFDEDDSDRTDDTAAKDTASHYTSKVNDSGEPVRNSALKQQIQDPDELREPIREFKALCYEDICLWVIKNRGIRRLKNVVISYLMQTLSDADEHNLV